MEHCPDDVKKKEWKCPLFPETEIFCSLQRNHVKIRIPKTKQGRTEVEDYYAADVKERYQVTPKEFIDLKALMGDTADNIPGVPSIGEKTATKIITEYHSIENAYEHVSELKPPRASKALAEHWDMAL